MSEKRGLYIAFEGGEFVGKSTQVRLAAEEFDALSVYEPGGTEIGDRVRNILLDKNIPKNPETEAFLHAAARSDQIRNVIRPALIGGQHVFSERFWMSSAAYQGALGMEQDSIVKINEIACGNLFKPDVVFLLDADPEDVLNRSGRDKDYYERMDMEFHRRVRLNYLELTGQMKGHIIDATNPIETVASDISNIISAEIELLTLS